MSWGRSEMLFTSPSRAPSNWEVAVTNPRLTTATPEQFIPNPGSWPELPKVHAPPHSGRGSSQRMPWWSLLLYLLLVCSNSSSLKESTGIQLRWGSERAMRPASSQPFRFNNCLWNVLLPLKVYIQMWKACWLCFPSKFVQGKHQ